MRFLFWWRKRRRRPRLQTIGEAEAYARSYGDRSDDIVAVERVPPPSPPPSPPPRVRPAAGRLTDATLRSAFLARLASRSDRRT